MIIRTNGPTCWNLSAFGFGVTLVVAQCRHERRVRTDRFRIGGLYSGRGVEARCRGWRVTCGVWRKQGGA